MSVCPHRLPRATIAVAVALVPALDRSAMHAPGVLLAGPASLATGSGVYDFEQTASLLPAQSFWI
jgi:hypothetical protein